MNDDVKKIRRENLLRALEQRYRSDADAARKTGINRTVLSQIRAGTREIGDRQAAHFERLLGLPDRALDYQDLQAPQEQISERQQAASASDADDIAAHIRSLPPDIRLPLELLARSLSARMQQSSPPVTAQVAALRLERRLG